uniref:Uncharacterized protein n=1 Tax=Oryza meridionalis TaxID=40149 RepID=A0A0E0DQ98_9ORYZ
MPLDADVFRAPPGHNAPQQTNPNKFQNQDSPAKPSTVALGAC